MNIAPLFGLPDRASNRRAIVQRFGAFIHTWLGRTNEASRSLLPQSANLLGCTSRDGHNVARCFLQRDSQAGRFPAAFLYFGTRPAVVVRTLTCNAVLAEIEFPNRVSFLGLGQVEEERAQSKSAAQFRRQARDRVAGRDPQAPSLRYRIHNLQCSTQTLARCTHQRTLHGREIESDGWNASSVDA